MYGAASIAIPNADPDTDAVNQRHPKHRTRARLLAGLGLCSVLVMPGCHTSSPAEHELAIPAPSWAVNPRRLQLDDGRKQLDFKEAEAYPSSRTRDFYAQWAKEHGWTTVPPESEPLSSDSWISFETESGRVHQWITHWRSPDGARSLRLALVHREHRRSQEVFLIESPFYVLPGGLAVSDQEKPIPTADGRPR